MNTENEAPAPMNVPTVSKKRTGNHVMESDQLMEMLRPGREFELKVQSLLKALPMGTANLLIIPLKDYSMMARALISYYSQEKMPGVYVTVNKPYADVLKLVSSLSTNVKFIDAITALTGKGTEDNAIVTYLDSPLALVEINLAISDMLKEVVSNQKFFILDSISTLLVYNSPSSVEKFCHTVIVKNRNENVVSLFLMIESEEHHSVVETLSQFVDNVRTIR